MTAFFNSPTGQTPQGMYVLDPKTGLPATPSSNIKAPFRDAFEIYEPGTGGRWVEDKASGDLVFADGNAAAASYLVISKDPWSAGTETVIEMVAAKYFRMPTEIAVGLSMSQRTLGQEFSVEAVDTDEPLPDVPDIAIASITQAAGVLTIDTALPHRLSVGKSMGVANCSDARANYPALVVASTPSPTQITCTAGPNGNIPSQTIANPAGAKGVIYFRQRFGRAKNGMSQIFENANAVQASMYVRSEAGDALPSGTIAGAHAWGCSTTNPVQLVNSAHTYAFGASTEYRLLLQSDRVQWADSGVDSTGQMGSRLVRTQVCPNPDKVYKLRLRATNNKSLTVPIAQVVRIVKTGATTAEAECDRPHLLAVGDPVVMYGVRDQTAAAFPNLTVATAVASVVSPTKFTIVVGAAGTVTSFGGYVAKVQGGNLMSSLGALTIVANTATLSTLADGTRQLVLGGNGNWGGLSNGNLVDAVGVRADLTGVLLGLDGPWKVANVVNTALTLVLPFADQRALPADFVTTNCGGGIIKRTDMYVSFVRVFDYERLRFEALARPSGDAASAAPTTVQNQVNVWGTANTTEAGFLAPFAYNLITAANTNPGLVKNTGGTVFGLTVTNNSPAPIFLKIYNSAAAPTVGTTVPVLVVPVAANSMFPLAFGKTGKRFATGIAVAVTGGMSTADATPVAAGCLVSLDYL